jgi:hypothetical protein
MINGYSLFFTIITAENETDFRQAGKYPPPTMPIPNTRQLSGEKTLKCHSKTANPTHPLISLPTDGRTKRKRKQKKEPKKSKDKEKP